VSECLNFVLNYSCWPVPCRSDVIFCLSEQVRNDTLRDAKHTISKECRQQLRAQLFQQRENVDFDPRLKRACTEDIQKFCAQVQKGGAQV
jgi:Golgi apparatus protein 1